MAAFQGTRLAAPGFSLADTLTCGQAFRWEEIAPNTFRGVSQGRLLIVSQTGESLCLHGVPEEEAGFWATYFDLDTDYAAFQGRFSGDPVLQAACRFCGGIRILRQDPWEALCSFIISQNNNIPRIRGIVDRLCRGFGEPVGDSFSFPSPKRLASCQAEELAPIRAGFRAKYILDAARKVSAGEIRLEELETMPVEEARRVLQTICGVGPKVAECALLYGFHRLEAFPIDTWIRKALERFYPGGFPEFAQPRGVAQQYLFHYIRQLDREL